MPDHSAPGSEKISKEEYQQRKAARDSEISRLRRLASALLNKWNFPELRGVTTHEAFLNAQQKNPRIPNIAWQDLSEAENALHKADELQRTPLSDIAAGSFFHSLHPKHLHAPHGGIYGTVKKSRLVEKENISVREEKVVSGVIVTVTNNQGFKKQTKTNAGGLYKVSELFPGEYQVSYSSRLEGINVERLVRVDDHPVMVNLEVPWTEETTPASASESNATGSVMIVFQPDGWARSVQVNPSLFHYSLDHSFDEEKLLLVLPSTKIDLEIPYDVAEDPDYVTARNRNLLDWEQRTGLSRSSPEGKAYMNGDPENGIPSQLRLDTWKSYREKKPDIAHARFLNGLKRVHRTPGEDPIYNQFLAAAGKAADTAVTDSKARGALAGITPDLFGIETRAKLPYLTFFATYFPEKARAYAASDPLLRKVLETLEQEYDETNSPEPTAEERQEALREYLLSEEQRTEADRQRLANAADQTAEKTKVPTIERKPMPAPTAFSTPSENAGGSPPSSPRARTMGRGNPQKNNRRAPSPLNRLAGGLNRLSNIIPQVRAIKSSRKIIIGLIIGIFLFIALFINGLAEEEKKNPDGSYKITIDKTGPPEVPNPPNDSDIDKPDESDITYQIKVTYAGAADRIIVTDPLDDNAEFVAAGGPGNPSYVESSHTVTWNIVPGSSTASSAAEPTRVTPTPRRTQSYDPIKTISSLIIPQTIHAQSNENGAPGTIHNLGFGPSNAERVEEMIRKLRPDSPIIGHGEDLVRYADEFNLDPLMIILTMKESQFCSDNGANSPAGSDPDNFNCGNITWDAAQDGAEVSRWKTRAGPQLTFDGFTYTFAFVPNMKDGLGLFFDYLDNPLYEGKTLVEFYETYNSCDNPGNRSSGFACGAESAREMLDLLEEYAGEPCTGSECTIGTDPDGTSFGSIPELTLTVRPKSKDSWVINQAFTEVIGARSSIPGSAPGRGRPGQPLPSNNVEEIKQVLCDDYKVCPRRTTAAHNAADSDWNLEQLTALWNVVQRMYESDTFVAHAIGEYTLEISRVGCYPTKCDNTWGFYSGVGARDLAQVNNSRFIGFTNLAATETSIPRLEWLFAHEIGHSASGGDRDGTVADAMGANEPSRKLDACGQIVSDYGYTQSGVEINPASPDENDAETISFYLTAGEEVNAGYLGPNNNLKEDFPCAYNVMKQYYFDGVEF